MSRSQSDSFFAGNNDFGLKGYWYCTLIGGGL